MPANSTGDVGRAVAAGIGVLAISVGGLGVATAASDHAHHASSPSRHHKAAASNATSGSGASTTYSNGERGILRPEPTLIARTAPLAKGTYYVNSSTTLYIPATGSGGFCYLSTSGAGGHAEGDENGQYGTGFFTVAETAVMKVKPKTEIAQYCSTEGNGSGEVVRAGIFAIFVAHSSTGKVIKGSPAG
jgi:hypothetical protein